MPPPPPRRPSLVTAFVLVATFAGGCAPEGGWPEETGVTSPAPSAAGTLGGLVHSSSGTPLAGVAVTSDPGGLEGFTAEDGTWLFPRVRPGTYRVVAAGPGWTTTTSDPVDVTDGAAATVDVTLLPAVSDDGTVRVRVIGPDGAAAAGAFVSASGSSGSVGTTADATGEAILRGLGGQTVRVEAEDTTGRLLPRAWERVDVPEQGGVQLAGALSGHPPVGSTPVGSRICGYCHPAQGATHGASAHGRAMGSVGGGLLAVFEAGVEVELDGGRASLFVDGTEPRVRLEGSDGEAVELEVAGVLGAADQVPWVDLGEQAYPLPIAWVAGDAARPGFPDAEPRVVPYEADRWFDSGGLLVDGGVPDPSASAEARCFGCHASGFDATVRDDGGVDFVATSGGGRWLEASVGCERCHGNGSGHDAAALEDAAGTIVRPDRLDPVRGDGVCRQCHGALTGHGTDLPYAFATTDGDYAPGDLLADVADATPASWPSGAAAAPGQESDELPRSAHAEGWAARCTDCHDGHAAVTDADAAPLPASLRQDGRDNTLCASCHLPLSFGGSTDTMVDHDGHALYDPAGPLDVGRCTSCHMPATASRVTWAPSSAAGDVASHLFLALSPAQTLAAFDAAGADVLPAGSFPTHACGECHAWVEFWFEDHDLIFPGPAGDPTLRATHEAYLDAYTELFP